MNLPIIRLELEGVKQSVAHMLADRGKEINDLIVMSLENTLKEEWIAEQINYEITECVKKSIKNLSNSYTLQSIITDMIEKTISEKLGEPNG